MQSISTYHSVFLNLYDYMKSHGFVGYDPYDFMSSPYASQGILARSPKLVIIATQMLKFSPVNIRHWLKIEKKQNLKTIVLTARSILNYFGAFERKKEMEEDFNSLVEVVLKNAKQQKESMSWSRIDYDYCSTTGLQSRDSSITYLTSLCGLLFLEAFEYYHSEDYLSIAEKIGNFLMSVEVYEKDDSLCYYYTTSLKNRIFNASAHACAFLGRLFSYTGRKDFLDRARKGFDYIAKGQMPPPIKNGPTLAT